MYDTMHFFYIAQDSVLSNIKEASQGAFGFFKYSKKKSAIVILPIIAIIIIIGSKD